MSRKTNSYDPASSLVWEKFMTTGWAPSPLEGVTASEAAPFCAARRDALSKMYPGVRLIIPAGNYKVRSNDTDYRFRPSSAYSWLTGITGTDAVPDSVLVLEPKKKGHEALLFVHPRSPRSTDEFFRHRQHGEFWVGRRLTIDETEKRYAIKVKHIDSLKKHLKKEQDSIVLRGEDAQVDKWVSKSKKAETILARDLSELRLLKDSWEIKEMQKAIDSTHRGFNDMVKAIPSATGVTRGERLVEGAFFTRARHEGNDLGYDSIVASGAHACVLHWIRNDGEVLPGDLILIDAGVEMESLYTSDITRTFPVNGKFSGPQREIYDLVYAAQQAGFAVAKPGVPFGDIHSAAQKVLAEGLERLGVLPISAEESLKPDSGVHRRWTVHGTCHMLGIDVHDCASARDTEYHKGVLKAGMILTVEPGLYIQPDDELFPVAYRGIGVRIEDDILITETGYENLSQGIPSQADDVEAWMRKIQQG